MGELSDQIWAELQSSGALPQEARAEIDNFFGWYRRFKASDKARNIPSLARDSFRSVAAKALELVGQLQDVELHHEHLPLGEGPTPRRDALELLCLRRQQLDHLAEWMTRAANLVAPGQTGVDTANQDWLGEQLSALMVRYEVGLPSRNVAKFVGLFLRAADPSITDYRISQCARKIRDAVSKINPQNSG